MNGVLDACCGGKMFYFDKHPKNVHFCDIRHETITLCDGRSFSVIPDSVADFRELPFSDASFSLVIFDPPHLVRAGKQSWMAHKYGKLGEAWRDDLSKGFAECWRVLKPSGTLIFKWNETQIKIAEVLKLFAQRPLLGQATTQSMKTHWYVYFKPVEVTA